METNISYTIVGVFVVSLCAAMVMAIIWLSSGFTLQHYSKYMVYMRDSVSGLTINSPVEYNGVEVGSVVNIALNHRDPQIVEVLLDIETGTPITTATIATLKPRGITGITYLSLKDESDTRTPLVAKRGQPYPVIKSGPSLFSRIDTMLETVTTNFEEITQLLTKLLDKQNLKSIKDILSNTDDITRGLAQNTDRITIILKNTATASQQLDALIKSGSGSLRTLQSQTLPMTYQVLTNLNTLTQNLTQFSTELKQNPSIMIRGATPAPLGPGETR